MSEARFETVVIAYRLSEAAVIQSMFEYYGIPTLVCDANTVRANAPWTLAVGGIRIQVLSNFAQEARDLLAEAAAREPAPIPVEERIGNFAFGFLMLLFGATPPPSRMGAQIIGRG